MCVIDYKIKVKQMNKKDCKEIKQNFAKQSGLNIDEFYLEQNGRPLGANVDCNAPIHCRLRVVGGKGGFGSMLRAIGAQIEKTTNREACRDLSGRRLRDINEEKRLKAWLDKQSEREREAEERKKRKVEKLLAVPKHEFKDEEYEQSRSKLTEKINDAVEEGLKKSTEIGNQLKRKHETTGEKHFKSKKKRSGLWIDDLSDINDTDDSDISCDPNDDNFKYTTSNSASTSN